MLRRMAEAASHRGPDGIHYFVQNHVGFVHLALHTTPESCRDRLPVCDPGGKTVLTADARVDNRDELIAFFMSKGRAINTKSTDSELILAAYEYWGPDCPQQIIGDYAFAIWDGRNGRLMCARDPVGIRPLFYACKGNALVFASTVSSILAVLPSPPSLNEPLIADFLCWRFDRWCSETVYSSICRLPVGSTLIAGASDTHVRKFWTFGAQATVQYMSDEDYVEHFRSLFREAVRVRLRSNTRVGIMVSGGLDSSSIACMAAEIARQDSESLCDRVHLYSWVFDRYPAADERKYVLPVHDHCQCFASAVLSSDAVWGFQEIGNSNTCRPDEPEVYPNRRLFSALFSRLRTDDCRAVLTGEGGDQVFSEGAYWMPILLADVAPARLFSEAGHFLQQAGWYRLCAALGHELLPRWTQRLMNGWPITLVRPRIRQREVPPWINEAWRRHCARPPTPAYSPVRNRSRSAEVMRGQLTGGWYVALLAYLDCIASWHAVEYRAPFLDRRLIDFQSSVPVHLRFSNGTTKTILRRALEGILPNVIVERTTKAHFSELVNYGLRVGENSKIHSMLEDIPQTQTRFVDAQGLQTAWREFFDHDRLPIRGFVAPLFLQAWLQPVYGSEQDN